MTQQTIIRTTPRPLAMTITSPQLRSRTRKKPAAPKTLVTRYVIGFSATAGYYGQLAPGKCLAEWIPGRITGNCLEYKSKKPFTPDIFLPESNHHGASPSWRPGFFGLRFASVP